MNAVHHAVHANAVTCAVSAAVVRGPNASAVSSHSPSRYARRCRAHASRSTSPRGCRTRRAGSRPSSTRARSPSCTRPVAAPPRTRLGCDSTRTTLPPGARPIAATQSVSQSAVHTSEHGGRAPHAHTHAAHEWLGSRHEARCHRSHHLAPGGLLGAQVATRGHDTQRRHDAQRRQKRELAAGAASPGSRAAEASSQTPAMASAARTSQAPGASRPDRLRQTPPLLDGQREAKQEAKHNPPQPSSERDRGRDSPPPDGDGPRRHL